MTLEQILSIRELELSTAPKSKLLRMFLFIRNTVTVERQSHVEEVTRLKNIISGHIETAEKAKKQKINNTVIAPGQAWERGIQNEYKLKPFIRSQLVEIQPDQSLTSRSETSFAGCFE